MRKRIEEILGTIIHPETGAGLAESGFIDEIEARDDKISVVLRFRRSRDPFAPKLLRQSREALQSAFPGAEISVEERRAEAAPAPEKVTFTGGIRRVIAVASGKGGVGKSTVTANLAAALRDEGYRVGILDADIYGPSQTKMFGVEGTVPMAEKEGSTDVIIPVETQGIKLMSIGFFVQPTDALLWRGPMATSALRQLIHQVRWGDIDFLLVDLPPGTGDIHLSIISELKIDGAVIVSTPQQIAVADVVRGVEMFRNPQVGIRVLGIVENMAWFTPRELPDNRYYLFGRGGAAEYARKNGIDFLGEIPIIQSVMESAEAGVPAVSNDGDVRAYYRAIALKIVEKSA